jgi:sugar phosphate isomerase/epimerase
MNRSSFPAGFGLLVHSGWTAALFFFASLGCLAAVGPPGNGVSAVIGEKASALLARPGTAALGGRAACSTLAQAKQPSDKAFRAIAELGYEWVDLSCLSWCRHVSVPALLEDFDREASRVETLLATNHLKAANFTFDAFEGGSFEQYEKQFRVVVKLAARLKARLINIMAPSNKADRQDVAAKLKRLAAMASRDGIILTIETHVGQITERPADALWLCQQVPGLGLTLDPSHYYAGPHQGGNFDALYPFVRGTGFRAGGMSWAEIQLPWGQGPIDFAAVVRKLEAAGYKGFYETEYIEGFNKLDALAESKRYLQWVKGL